MNQAARRLTPPAPPLTPSPPLATWWAQQLLQSTAPMTRVQLAWMEGIADTMEVEARFLKALAESGQQLSRSMEGEGALSNPAEAHAHYQKHVDRVTDAHRKRLDSVAELSREVRARIWEEL